jgi:hypothetical protein
VKLGQTPPIEPNAAPLIAYTSPNTGQGGSTLPRDDPNAVLTVARLRSEVGKDEAIVEAIECGTRKDYPIFVGVSLEIPDAVGDESHEIRFFEEERFFPMTSNAEELFQWLCDRIRSRSPSRTGIQSMPPNTNELNVHIQKRGDWIYIRFIHQDDYAKGYEICPIHIRVEYLNGFAIFGMSDRYTMRMLAEEFRALIPDWLLTIIPSVRRDSFVMIIHETRMVNNLNETTADDQIFCGPPRVAEDAGRGTEIKLLADQVSVLDFWAHAGQQAMVGISLQIDNYTVEYWIPMTIEPIIYEPWNQYLIQLQTRWYQKLCSLSPLLQDYFMANPQCVFRMRYQFNTLRLSFARYDQAVQRPLAEEAVPKDMWYSAEAQVITCPINERKNE